LKEAREYANYLEKKSARPPGQLEETSAEFQTPLHERLLTALSTTKTAAAALEVLELRLEKFGPGAQGSEIKAAVTEAIPLTLQTKFEKARVYSFELKSHLESKAKSGRNSAGHYDEILQNITTLSNALASLDAAPSLQILDQELTGIEKEIVPLTKQAPYTLLMMRVVEIGLPVLLSIFSIFFLFRYSLTEKRSHEIKFLLRQRNEKHLAEAGKAPGTATP